MMLNNNDSEEKKNTDAEKIANSRQKKVGEKWGVAKVIQNLKMHRKNFHKIYTKYFG